MADGNAAWNSYIDKFGNEPKGASQLQKFSQTDSSCKNLNFKEARTVFDANKGKGKVGGGGGGASASAAAAASGGGGGGDLFSELNKGLNVTSGLKKVTKDMKSKNQPNRSGKVPAGPTKAKAAPKKSGGAKAKAVKPPSMNKKGPRLWVENYVEGTHELKECDVKTEIYFYNCKNSGFSIKNKVKAVIMDNCNRAQAEVSEVVSSVEQINCKSCTYYLQKNIPTVNIDKCSNTKLVLFKEVVQQKPEIITSMTSDMNISFPGKTENDDWKEVPVPYQFKTFIDPDTGAVKTEPVTHDV